MRKIPYQVIDWSMLPLSVQPGATGSGTSSIMDYGGLRIRIVEYSAGYLADHWCKKGHIVYCLEGEVTSELENGESFLLRKGMMYIVSDNLSSHKSHTNYGAKLLIIDGDFLK